MGFLGSMANENAFQLLEALRQRYNWREFVHPDPIEFLYRYEDVRDREIAGLVAASLAYGRVSQILKAVSGVLYEMGPSPRAFVESAAAGRIKRAFGSFRYRFTTGEELAALFLGTRRVLKEHGSLEHCFSTKYSDAGGDVPEALDRFAGALCPEKNSLMPRAANGGACKRLNLYLRWMVRRDDVDPGGWAAPAPAALIMPLDTHIHRICTDMGLTRRRAADMRTARDITDAFSAFAPHDPTRYDFAIARLGIRKDTDPARFVSKFRAVYKG